VAEPVAEHPAAPASNTATLADFVTMWPAVLDVVRSAGRVAYTLFSPSAPVSLDNGILAVAVDQPGKVKNIKDGGHDERLRQAILDVLAIDVRIDVVPDAARATGTAVAAVAAAQPAPPAASAEPDAPSLDDPDVDPVSGVDLAMRELGATRIGEIEH
jgi:hypothetical protein